MFQVNKKRREKHLAFVQANWKMLAALAYKGCLEHGRGMVYIDEKGWIHLPPGVVCKVPCHYIAEGSPEFQKLGAWPGEKETGWVKDYDPEATVLFVFVRAEREPETSSYRIRAIPGHSPKECAAERKAEG